MINLLNTDSHARVHTPTLLYGEAKRTTYISSRMKKTRWQQTSTLLSRRKLLFPGGWSSLPLGAASAGWPRGAAEARGRGNQTTFTKHKRGWERAYTRAFCQTSGMIKRMALQTMSVNFLILSSGRFNFTKGIGC